ncbi:Hypothetical protein, putative [Bodo saltans]|uniref:Uncharacterized protein n=1 Tax=Bodo saltans TaxID=75058 RepID=A0A0S4IVE0_BODSA|nr:Hypothetical protein, putative [Bodo saltans]|eukprot:CUG01687.1 Hypothetical protein, putative [Bodo saltans]
MLQSGGYQLSLDDDTPLPHEARMGEENPGDLFGLVAAPVDVYVHGTPSLKAIDATFEERSVRVAVHNGQTTAKELLVAFATNKVASVELSTDDEGTHRVAPVDVYVHGTPSLKAIDATFEERSVRVAVHNGQTTAKELLVAFATNKVASVELSTDDEGTHRVEGSQLLKPLQWIEDGADFFVVRANVHADAVKVVRSTPTLGATCYVCNGVLRRLSHCDLLNSCNRRVSACSVTVAFR